MDNIVHGQHCPFTLLSAWSVVNTSCKTYNTTDTIYEIFNIVCHVKSFLSFFSKYLYIQKFVNQFHIFFSNLSILADKVFYGLCIIFDFIHDWVMLLLVLDICNFAWLNFSNYCINCICNTWFSKTAPFLWFFLLCITTNLILPYLRFLLYCGFYPIVY